MLTETLKIGVLITVNTLIESNFDAYPKHIKFTIFISFKIYEPENLPICLPEERSRMCFFFPGVIGLNQLFLNIGRGMFDRKLKVLFPF